MKEASQKQSATRRRRGGRFEKLFHIPTLWVSESMVFGCGITYVLGSAWSLQENRHVKIDLIYGEIRIGKN